MEDERLLNPIHESQEDLSYWSNHFQESLFKTPATSIISHTIERLHKRQRVSLHEAQVKSDEEQHWRNNESSNLLTEEDTYRITIADSALYPVESLDLLKYGPFLENQLPISISDQTIRSIPTTESTSDQINLSNILSSLKSRSNFNIHRTEAFVTRLSEFEAAQLLELLEIMRLEEECVKESKEKLELSSRILKDEINGLVSFDSIRIFYDDKPFQCQACGLRFKNSLSKSLHLESKFKKLEQMRLYKLNVSLTMKQTRKLNQPVSNSSNYTNKLRHHYKGLTSWILDDEPSNNSYTQSKHVETSDFSNSSTSHFIFALKKVIFSSDSQLENKSYLSLLPPRCQEICKNYINLEISSEDHISEGYYNHDPHGEKDTLYQKIQHDELTDLSQAPASFDLWKWALSENQDCSFDLKHLNANKLQPFLKGANSLAQQHFSKNHCQDQIKPSQELKNIIAESFKNIDFHNTSLNKTNNLFLRILIRFVYVIYTRDEIRSQYEVPNAPFIKIFISRLIEKFVNSNQLKIDFENSAKSNIFYILQSLKETFSHLTTKLSSLYSQSSDKSSTFSSNSLINQDLSAKKRQGFFDPGVAYSTIKSHYCQICMENFDVYWNSLYNDWFVSNCMAFHINEQTNKISKDFDFENILPIFDTFSEVIFEPADSSEFDNSRASYQENQFPDALGTDPWKIQPEIFWKLENEFPFLEGNFPPLETLDESRFTKYTSVEESQQNYICKTDSELSENQIESKEAFSKNITEQEPSATNQPHIIDHQDSTQKSFGLHHLNQSLRFIDPHNKPNKFICIHYDCWLTFFSSLSSDKLRSSMNNPTFILVLISSLSLAIDSFVEIHKYFEQR